MKVLTWIAGVVVLVSSCVQYLKFQNFETSLLMALWSIGLLLIGMCDD